jgi:hypothetical protein
MAVLLSRFREGGIAAAGRSGLRETQFLRRNRGKDFLRLALRARGWGVGRLPGGEEAG